jgi:hypothetical protein
LRHRFGYACFALRRTDEVFLYRPHVARAPAIVS